MHKKSSTLKLKAQINIPDEKYQAFMNKYETQVNESTRKSETRQRKTSWDGGPPNQLIAS